MGFGMGFALDGLRQGMDDARRREREDFQLEEQRKQAQRVDTQYQQQQEDRSFSLPMQRRAMERNDELGGYSVELSRNEMAISRLLHGASTETAKMEAFAKVRELEEKNYGIVYSAFKERGGKAAAQLFNQMRGNSIQNAADFVVEADPRTKKQTLKIVDANGQVVQDEKHGPAAFDLAQLEARHGKKPEKGRYHESERGILDTGTGNFRPHSPGVAGNGGSADAKKYNEMVALGVPPNVARGVAYGTIKQVQSGDGMSQALVDMSNNQTLGTLQVIDDMAVWRPSPDYRGSGASALDGGQLAKIQQDAEKQAAREAKKKASWFKFDEADFGMSRDEWVKKRTAEIVAEETTGFRLPGAAGSQGDKLPHIRNETDYKALSPGAIYLAPDGTTRRKSGGTLPVGVTKQKAIADAQAVAHRASAAQMEQIRQRLRGWGIADSELEAAGLDF